MQVEKWKSGDGKRGNGTDGGVGWMPVKAQENIIGEGTEGANDQKIGNSEGGGEQ